MEKRYYLAYGSNLNVDQMDWRCPNAIPLGKAYIEDYELLFKGSKTGSYLTIEPQKGGRVPVVVWLVTEWDEEALDRYEGFPRFYYKKHLSIAYTAFDSEARITVDAFVYIMHEDRPIGIPTLRYVRDCLDGYDSFGIDETYLFDAYERSEKGVKKNGIKNKKNLSFVWQ